MSNFTAIAELNDGQKLGPLRFRFSPETVEEATRIHGQTAKSSIIKASMDAIATELVARDLWPPKLKAIHFEEVTD